MDAVPGLPPVYLDHAATTRVRPEVRRAMAAAEERGFGNPSSAHAAGRAARACLDAARDRLAAVLGADPSGIVFTAGGSEADNLALRGVAAATGPGHLVISGVEHEAVLRTASALERSGWEVTRVAVDRAARVDPERLRSALRPETRLVSIMAANNEVGTVQPLAELVAVVRRHSSALFHTDAVQALGRLPLDARSLGVDLLAVSAHKCGGPKGVGALWARPGTRLVPQLTGGLQERGQRAGTENVPGIVGFGLAAALAEEERPLQAVRQRRLADRLRREVLAGGTGAVATGAEGEERLPGFATFAFPEVAGDLLLLRLDRAGIQVSAGSACTSGAVHPSHVLAAMGLPPELAAGGLRCTTGRATTEAEVDRAGAAIVAAALAVRAAAVGGPSGRWPGSATALPGPRR